MLESENKSKEIISDKDSEIARLKAQLESNEAHQALTLQNAVSEAEREKDRLKSQSDSEITRLNAMLEQSRIEKELAVKDAVNDLERRRISSAVSLSCKSKGMKSTSSQ